LTSNNARTMGRIKKGDKMFELTEEQRNRLTEWQNTLEKQYTGAIGGAYTYLFTPTALGLIIQVYYLKATKKEQRIDLTDYSSW